MSPPPGIGVNLTFKTSSLAYLLIAGIVLAGCAGKAPIPASTSAPIKTVATYTPETGGIEGTVVDTEAQPIAGAKVGIVGGNGTTVQTSPAGLFAFSELTPGSHKVAVEAVGFKSVIKLVDVVAGNATKVRMVLESVPLVAAAPANTLTATNNVLWLHTDNTARKIWMNDTVKSGPGETDYYGVNGAAFVFAAGGAVEFTVPITPDLASTVQLDKSKTVDVTLYFRYYFSDKDVGQIVVSMDLMNGDAKVISGGGKTVTLVGDGAVYTVQWSETPLVNSLDPAKDLTWNIHASGPSSGYSIGSKGTGPTSMKSSIILPVV